ncbi:peptide deformylase, mitochondrial isoform X1 [Phyllopteryx taeniolatus]|uniref:peptide deformylase, mitochondrial isoform X1 n=1 Tax=Phyllopteryx taeniolatus TaxID=161469 RepID=UPI002AD1E2E4|nr:peptide deformylase, mitochondrial isoform X1 [Phyllopteryx taeniolatus]XP_061628612.1 peptide deformylase, mitochondrial isoform X1 [Phyllopteryx taeniolatus]XP_061628614.1 peptide deformylase, mitochondrial isoform X1 [Phyllopteryx taeniolatus]
MARCSSRLHLSHLGLRLCAALSTPFPHVLVANAYSTNVKARSYFQYIKQKIIAPPSPPFDHVCQVGDPVLRSRAAAVDRAAIKGPEVQKVINTLVKVMRKFECVGISAPQIGVPLRILALEYPQKMLDVSSPVSRKVHGLSVQPLRIFVNPELRVLDWQTVLFREACESICGFSATVPRYLSVEVSGLNERGEDTTWQGSGWPARILQHEMDHLDGVLYIDHMDSKTFINVNWLAYNE